jgi:hypothetical protein
LREAPGGIRGLVELHQEHGEVIEADFARYYQGADPEAVTLRRYGVLVRGLLKMPRSLLHLELANDDWSLTDHLLAVVHDQLAIANWQRTGKKSGRPKPISPLANRGTRYGKTDRDPEEVKAYLRRLNPAQYEGR